MASTLEGKRVAFLFTEGVERLEEFAEGGHAQHVGAGARS